MKKLLFIAIPLLILSEISLAGDPPNNVSIAIINRTVKDVTYKKAGQSDWEIAKTGTPLKDGEQVKTGANSIAIVQFTDESGLLRVRENTILNIYGSKNGNRIDKNMFIAKGKLGFKVSKQGDEEFKFTTPTAVASIRGTEGLFQVDSTGTTLVAISGIIDVKCPNDPNKYGQLNPGQTLKLNENCEMIISPSTAQEVNDYKETLKITNKKVKIKTPYGDIEIEYYQ